MVHDGALMENGMPRYEMFTRPQVMQIYAYIRACAREALGGAEVAPQPVRNAPPAGAM